MSALSRTVFYFAYGSNMDPQRMEQRRKEGTVKLWPSDKNVQVAPASPIGAASLAGYILNFDKISRNCPDENFASVSPQAGSVVEGVLYQLNEKFIQILDLYEGVASDQYTQEQVEVALKTSETYKAIIYIAHPKAIIKQGKSGTPSKEYLDIILRGAREFNLSAEWIAKLEKWPTASSKNFS